MNDIAIKVENLSKRYRIGLSEKQAETLVGGMAKWLKSPLQNYRRLRNLSAFDEEEGRDIIWALRDISFQVQRGEVLGIIGMNGAGKSTLLKILSRITPPTRGSVLLNGRVASLLEVGTGFHPELTGRENVYLNGTILGMTRREINRRFDEIVDFSGVETFIDTPVKRYSSGMRVRLAFSVAAHLEPEVLLIDEVLAVGDTAFQRKSLNKMDEVAGSGRTVLFVSHNMSAVSSLTQRCILLENGSIRANDDTETVIDCYLDSTQIEPDEDYVDLTKVPRIQSLTKRNVQFTFIRTLTEHGTQTSTFLEEQPWSIEIGFAVDNTVRNLQLGCSIRQVNHSILFTSPSPEYHRDFKPGHYVIRLCINPNYLRQGHYTLTPKLFIDGVRQDVVFNAIHISVHGNLSNHEKIYAQRWVTGPLRFNNTWELVNQEA